MKKPNVAMIGLGVMGSNLALNIESRGVPLVIYNRGYQVTQDFMQKNPGRDFKAVKTLEQLVKSLSRPRQIFMMIKAGSPVDETIESLSALLDKDDILLDGGNSFYLDTERRVNSCREAGFHFLGLGISGGQEGALLGPSIMPGGPEEAWRVVAPLLEKIAAQADGPCTTYIGPGGSGHFVKMVHNGIEYGDMQLIAETYHILKEAGKFEAFELAEIFEKWNQGALSSYLVEVT